LALSEGERVSEGSRGEYRSAQKKVAKSEEGRKWLATR